VESIFTSGSLLLPAKAKTIKTIPIQSVTFIPYSI
jgi:hypothetical protein